EEKKALEKDLASFADKDRRIKYDYDTRYPNLDDNTDTAASDSNAQEITTFDNLLALEHLLELRLKDVDEALEKIKHNDGSYGKCEICHNDIEINRLKINPAARICAKCALNSQKQNK
ncbi:MAG: TraR/DksA family transcriptional regulator, partial [Minisyncoccia bacterium]